LHPKKQKIAFVFIIYNRLKKTATYILKNRKFIVFINPISGTKNKEQTIAIVEQKLIVSNYPYQILPTEKSADYSFLKTKIAAEKITDIIICGGDGTVNQVAAFLQNEEVNVGIIPMGSGNGLAFTAGIPKAPQKAMDVILNGTTSYIDSFWVNEQFACHNFGVGFDARIAHEFAEGTNRGPFNYLRLTAKNYFKAKPHSFTIKVDNTTLEVKAFFVAVLNSNQFGNSLTIAPKATLNDGLLDIVIVKKENKFSLFFKLINQLKRGKIASVTDDKRTFHYFQTKKIIISNTEMELIHIDGEPVKPMQEITIKIIEKAFKLIQP
jgi:diacylglycerol kinase (ATP)